MRPGPVHPAYQQLTYRHCRLTSARFTRDGGSVVYPAAWDGQPLTVYKRVAFIAADGRCLLLPIDNPGAVHDVPGSYLGELVCGFREGGSELFIRSASLPIRIRRVDVATGRSVPHLEILPPALGLKGVDALALSASGEAYAYSYGQELNRLYTYRADGSAGEGAG